MADKGKEPAKGGNAESGAKKDRPPPPKPSGTSSWRVDTALINSVLPQKITPEQMSHFVSLMGVDNEMVAAEVILLNLGIVLGLFDDYMKDFQEKKGEKHRAREKRRKKALEAALSNYNWVFFTDNPLGTQLRQMMENMVADGSLTKVDNTDCYIVSV